MLYVVDSNVLIDLHKADLLSAAFSLPVTFGSPDVVLAELEVPSRKTLLELGLEERELAGEQVKAVVGLNSRHPKPSRIDMFVLQLAIAEDALLLTGDRDLREAARKEDVEVHGTIWLLDQLVQEAVVEPAMAALSLGRLLKTDPPRRLPDQEVHRRLKSWVKR